MRANIDKYDITVWFYIKNSPDIAGNTDASTIFIFSGQRMIIK